MALSFIDNFITPLTLPAGEAEVATDLGLPDGEYLLTMADSAADATRYEIVFAWTEDGVTWIWRNPSEGLAEWPQGSVIYCAVNAEVLSEIFYELEYITGELNDGGGYKLAYGLSTLYGATLTGDTGRVTGLVSGGIARLDVDQDMPEQTVAEHIIIVEIYPSGTLRLHGNGRPVVEARLQNHPNLIFTMGPDGEYVDINVSSFFRCMIRLQTEIRLYDEQACAFIATFHDLEADFSLLSSPPPNHS